MKCYKVLYRDVKNNLMSVGAAFNHPNELILEYVLGKETVAPEGTKLFVFDGYVNAMRFVKASNLNHNKWSEIWEVKAKPIRGITKVLMIDTWGRFGVIYRKMLKSYWRCALRDNAHTILNTMRAPAGTLVCDSVILKRRVS